MTPKLKVAWQRIYKKDQNPKLNLSKYKLTL